jgi:hypothetical protein
VSGELTGNDWLVAEEVAEELAALLDKMNASGVPGLELQRTDPPTPYELVARALQETLRLLGAEDPVTVYGWVAIDGVSVVDAVLRGKGRLEYGA